MLAQIGGQRETEIIDLIRNGHWSTLVVLGVCAVFSISSWVIIMWKLGQFRRVKRDGVRFTSAVERTQRLEDVNRAVMRLPDSAHTRVFRQGINFFSELRP